MSDKLADQYHKRSKIELPSDLINQKLKYLTKAQLTKPSAVQ